MESQRLANSLENNRPKSAIIHTLDKDALICIRISDVLWSDGITESQRKMKLAEALADAYGETFHVNHILVKNSLYFEYGELLQEMIDAVQKANTMQQAVFFQGKVKIDHYKDKSLEIRMKNRDLQIVFFGSRVRENREDEIQVLLKEISDRAIDTTTEE